MLSDTQLQVPKDLGGHSDLKRKFFYFDDAKTVWADYAAL